LYNSVHTGLLEVPHSRKRWRSGWARNATLISACFLLKTTICFYAPTLAVFANGAVRIASAARPKYKR
jgi:hypothetical protein